MIFQIPSSDYPVSHGVISFGKFPSNPVVVVTGISRTGTSLLVELVSTLIPVKWDDLELFESNSWKDLVEKCDIESLRNFFPESPIAVKVPEVYHYSETLREAYGERLCYFVSVRNYLSPAIRNFLAYGGKITDWLEENRKRQNELHEWIMVDPSPKFIVSYDSLVISRGHVRHSILKFMRGSDEMPLFERD